MIYIEETLRDHPQVEYLKKRLQVRQIIWIHHYGEIFNRHRQHFRLQKESPAFILAKKNGRRIHPIPPTYGIGRPYNYYFSHILNCPFDCRYCFLQGMYRSANYVLFLNYEDFQCDMEQVIKEKEVTFFSGYDGDSLAFEPYTRFLASFLPFFRHHPEAELEVRTKSVGIRFLLEEKPLHNVVIAYSLNPAPIAKAFEKKAPSFEARLRALRLLQEKGWKVGLRFDPILDVNDFATLYAAFFHQVFTTLDTAAIHSVTLGTFRLPKPLYKAMCHVLPNEALLAQCSDRGDDKMGLSKRREKEMIEVCLGAISPWIAPEKLFLCQ